MNDCAVCRREFMKRVGLAVGAMALPLSVGAKEDRPLNVMLFTADDLNGDSLGCFGSGVADISPNLDRFAGESMRFERAHVSVAICQPSRGALGTGLYPHHSGVMGFMHTERPVATVMQTFRDAGYLTGVLGKVQHSTPKADYVWDFVHDQNELGGGRSPKIYHDYCVEFLTRCRNEGKPFYFMVNSHDPHRPFHEPVENYRYKANGAEPPSRLFTPDEIRVPGFVPDLPDVRKEVSYYFNSVRRLDDTFGRVMAALEETGFADNTLVMFLSDNGMSLPFAKCNTYLASTHTPWMVRWPGVVKGGAVDKEHFISGIDFMPTALEAAGLPPIDSLDGVSFVPLLNGREQAGRDHVFTQIDCKAGGGAVPMRCIQNARFGYIFTAWADGEFLYRNNNEGMTMKAMEAAAPNDPFIAERVRMFRYRTPEEFYDLQNDPNCLKNLIDDPAYAKDVDALRTQLANQMKQSGDPLLPSFEERATPKQMSATMAKAYAQYGGKKGKKSKSAAKSDKAGGARSGKRGKRESGARKTDGD